MLRDYSLPRENEDSHTSWQLEPLRACRSWIEEQRLTEPFRFRLVRVTENTDVRLFSIEKRSPFPRQLAALIHDMTDGDTEPGQYDHIHCWKLISFELIDIARNCRYRRNGLKLLDDRPVSNIPGVENAIDPFEVSPDSRIEQTVGVGNHSDANSLSLIHGTTTG